jgi:hypothetical protein
MSLIYTCHGILELVLLILFEHLERARHNSNKWVHSCTNPTQDSFFIPLQINRNIDFTHVAFPPSLVFFVHLHHAIAIFTDYSHSKSLLIAYSTSPTVGKRITLAVWTIRSM